MTGVVIAPDGSWFATISGDYAVRIWEAATGTVLAMMRTDQQLQACAWKPSGNALATGGPGGLYGYSFSCYSPTTHKLTWAAGFPPGKDA